MAPLYWLFTAAMVLATMLVPERLEHGHLTPGRVPYRAFQVPETSGTTRVVSPRFVRLAHKAGLVVQVWTVDEEADMRRLLEWGVDGLISNRPDCAVRVRNEFLARH